MRCLLGVQGNLTFQPGMDLVLRAVWVVVMGRGRLQAGSSTTPHVGSATIALAGGCWARVQRLGSLEKLAPGLCWICPSGACGIWCMIMLATLTATVGRIAENACHQA